MVSIVLGKKSGVDGQHAAACGTCWIFGTGSDVGHAFTGVARARPASRLLALHARAGAGELFLRSGFSRAAGATAGAESHGSDSALGKLVFKSGAHLEGHWVFAAAHPCSDYSEGHSACERCGTGARCRRGCDHRVESRGAAGGWRHWCTRCAAGCGVRGERPCARVVRQRNSSWGGRFQGAGAGRASGVAWPALHVGPRGGGRSGRAGCFAESSCRSGLNDGVEQIHFARQGVVTEEMEYVAKREKLEPELIRSEVERGRMIIPANVNHRNLEPMAIGIASKCKINANIGNSSTSSNIDEELKKLHHAVHYGARSEEHTSELQSQSNLVCRLL